MSNIDKQAQKELYAKVEQQAHSLRGNPREYLAATGMCPVNVIEMHAQKIQALLDELEAKGKSISFLKDQLAQLANFNPDWDKLEAATDSLREHMAELTAARKRIAELEVRPDTVRLPDEVIVLLNHLEDVLPCEAFNSIDVKTWNAVSRLAATGIRINGEG